MKAFTSRIEYHITQQNQINIE